MKRISTCIPLVLLAGNALAQNLFGNPGFENYSQCPTTNDQAAYAIGVVNKVNTPDYLNCSMGATFDFAHAGTGRMYLGAVKYISPAAVTQEAIMVALSTPLTVGTTYTISIYDRYGYKYPNTGFNPALVNDCYKLAFKFMTSSVNPITPITFDRILDPESVVGNSNTNYNLYSFSFVATQASTHLFIQTMPTSKTLSNHADCLNTVFYNLLDDLSIVPASVLGVDLTRFTGEPTASGARLHWETASELQNDFFTIERSADGIEWEFVQKTDGAGTSEIPSDYTLVTDLPEREMTSFRLSQTDMDGKRTELGIVSVENRSEEDVRLFPNPVADELTLEFAGNRQEFLVEVINPVGQCIYTGSMTETTIINTASFAPGIYTVRLSNDAVIYRKVIRE